MPKPCLQSIKHTAADFASSFWNGRFGCFFLPDLLSLIFTLLILPLSLPFTLEVWDRKSLIEQIVEARRLMFQPSPLTVSLSLLLNCSHVFCSPGAQIVHVWPIWLKYRKFITSNMSNVKCQVWLCRVTNMLNVICSLVPEKVGEKKVWWQRKECMEWKRRRENFIVVWFSPLSVSVSVSHSGLLLLSQADFTARSWTLAKQANSMSMHACSCLCRNLPMHVAVTQNVCYKHCYTHIQYMHKPSLCTAAQAHWEFS